MQVMAIRVQAHVRTDHQLHHEKGLVRVILRGCSYAMEFCVHLGARHKAQEWKQADRSDLVKRRRSACVLSRQVIAELY